MTLRDVHDFTLALLDVTLAMTARGLPVDEHIRQDMLADLDRELQPLTADVERVAVTALKAAKQVPRRALFVPKLRKAELVALAVAEGVTVGSAKKRTKAVLQRYVKARGGLWTFRATSHTQRKVLLYDVLKLPKRHKDGKLTTDQEALKSILLFDDAVLVEEQDAL